MTVRGSTASGWSTRFARADVGNSGFLPEERAGLDRRLEAGWLDTFHALHPDEPDPCSWWTQRGGARARLDTATMQAVARTGPFGS